MAHLAVLFANHSCTISFLAKIADVSYARYQQFYTPKAKGQVCHQLNIRIYILTPFYTFCLVLTRRICLFIKASWVGNHFLYSHDYNEWFSSITVTVRRNEMLVTVKGLRYQKLNEQAFRYGQVFLKRAFMSTLMFQQPQLKSRSVREYVNLLPLLPSSTNGLLSISCPNFNMDHVVTLFLC